MNIDPVVETVLRAILPPHLLAWVLAAPVREGVAVAEWIAKLIEAEFQRSGAAAKAAPPKP